MAFYRRLKAVFLLVLVGVVGVVPLLVAQGQPQIARSLERAFPLIDKSAQLYDVGMDYVLQKLSEGVLEVKAIRIVPRFYFADSHPSWIKPQSAVSLPIGSYRETLARLESIAPLGKILNSGSNGEVVDGGTNFWDEYENGFVERTMLSAIPEDGISRFTAWYFYVVRGRVDSKSTTATGYVVRIGGKSYRVTAREFSRATLGRANDIRVAGPF